MSVPGLILGPLRRGVLSLRDPSAFRPSPAAFLTLLAGVSFLFVACSGGIPAGEPAPDFELELFGNANTTSGEPLKLADLKGTPVVLNFWYPSCGPCRLEMPHIEEVSRKHGNNDVRFLSAQAPGFDSKEDGQAFVDELGLTFSVGFAEARTVADYKIVRFPSTVFLNKRHEIVRTWEGALNAAKLEELVQELIQ